MSRLKECILVLVFLSLMIPSNLIGHVNANYPGNKCLEFDGLDDYIGCSELNAQRFTIELWVKPKYRIEAGSDSVYQHETGFLISIGSTILGYFNYKSGDLHLDLYIYAGYGGYPKYVRYAGSRHVWEPLWYHIAIVHDGSTLTCYVNATVDLIANIRQVIPYGDIYHLEYYSAAGRIGTAINDTSLAFGGLIDEVRYWNISRSPAEITQTFNRILNATEISSPNLVGYWRLDDGPGATSCNDYSLRKTDAQLGGSPSTPLWTDIGAPIIPEFPSFLILPLFFTLTLLALIVYKRKA